MTRFILIFTLAYTLLGDGIAILIGKPDHLLPLTGGGILGIVNFLLLSRTIMGIPAGGESKKFSMKNVLFLFIVSILFVVLALWTGRAMSVLLGFSTFVLALMTYAVKEVFHA
ncbi:MAG TPA: hypothetical protein PK014_04750 [Thermoanaerobaculia bacterium]|nr:hypothetical protein [Thermoanaerobaculia bacterium]HUM29542.1 hypothetical protein [Thermoanaerobaculia bacterium]HXK67925.1 hypothetical protein [Thermoanaerobaculia bacterium]